MIKKKVCMVGAFAVGKTSLIRRAVAGSFSDNYESTLGVITHNKSCMVNGTEITLVLWDMAGEDTVTKVRTANLSGASGYILVADGARAKTLEVARDLETRVKETLKQDVPHVLVINKSDLKKNWELTAADIAAVTREDLPVFEASAKTGDDVERFLQYLAERI